MKRKRVIFLIGFVVLVLGWAIRSTFVMHSYSSKPLGGIIMAVGMLVMGISLYKIFKNGNSIRK